MTLDLRRYCEKYSTDTVHAFVYWCKDKLLASGYMDVKVVQDKEAGVDILAVKDGKSYAIQCIYTSSTVGLKSVKTVYSGSKDYDCDYAVLITNSKLSDKTKEYANNIGVVTYSEGNIDCLLSNLRRMFMRCVLANYYGF